MTVNLSPVGKFTVIRQMQLSSNCDYEAAP